MYVYAHIFIFITIATWQIHTWFIFSSVPSARSQSLPSFLHPERCLYGSWPRHSWETRWGPCKSKGRESLCQVHGLQARVGWHQQHVWVLRLFVLTALWALGSSTSTLCSWFWNSTCYVFRASCSAELTLASSPALWAQIPWFFRSLKVNFHKKHKSNKAKFTHICIHAYVLHLYVYIHTHKIWGFMTYICMVLKMVLVIWP